MKRVLLALVVIVAVLATASSAGATPTAPAPDNPNTAEHRSALFAQDSIARDAQLRHLLEGIAGKPAHTTLKLGLLGDSMTVGYGSVDMQGYKTYLRDLLDRRGIDVTFVSLATGGWTVNDLQTGLGAFLTTNPDLDYVLMMIGTNDVAWGMSLIGWGAKVEAVIQTVLNSNGKVKVLAGKIPLSATVNAANYPTLYIYEDVINGWIATAASHFAGTGRVAIAETSVPTQMLTDFGWHPGDAGYLWEAGQWVLAMQALGGLSANKSAR